MTAEQIDALERQVAALFRYVRDLREERASLLIGLERAREYAERVARERDEAQR